MTVSPTVIRRVSAKAAVTSPAPAHPIALALSLLTLAGTGWPVLGCTRQSSAPPAPGEASRPLTGPEPPGLVIFYGADERGHYAPSGTDANARGGLSRRASLLDETRVSGVGLLLVDAGDAVATIADAPELDVGSAAGLDLRARTVLTAFKRMGIDAMVPGERELAMGADALRSLLADTKVTMVAANLGEASPPSGQKPLFEATRLVDEGGGRQVGIFGVVDLSPAAIEHLRHAGFAFGDAVSAARSAAADLRAHGASFLVALIHADGGPGRVRQILAGAGLASGPTAVDVVVVGHDDGLAANGAAGAAASSTTSTTSTSRPIERPAIVQAGALGNTVGRIDSFWPRPDAGGLGGASARLEDRVVPITSELPEQLGVALIGRILTTHIVDNGHLANESGFPTAANANSEAFENWDYGSSAGCAFCHQHQDVQWRGTDHAHALETLKTGGHDRQPECLGCHLTGFLAPGGTRNLKTAYTFFADVGCEACHGPSVTHMRAPNSHHGTSRKVAGTVCLGCHTPDQSRGTFDLGDAMKQIVGPGHGVPGSKPTG